MYGIVEGEPFKVYARRENHTADHLVIKFECKDGMGVLGIRKVGRGDPPPSAAYEEEEIEPASLRAGRFVHVLPSGQRQSYALSRISPEFAGRLPSDRWVELKPHTEYGFRYLVAPDEQLEPARATAAVVMVAGAPAAAVAAVAAPAADPEMADSAAVPVAVAPPQAPRPAPTARVVPTPPPAAQPGPTAAGSLPPPQTPVAPQLAQSALNGLSKEQAVEHLKAEMSKVHVLQQRVAELEQLLHKGRARERDLLDVLGRWQSS